MQKKKKKLEIGEGRQEQWKPTMDFFFLSREFSYKHLEWFFTILVYAVLVFLEKWMQKNSKFELEGEDKNWK